MTIVQRSVMLKCILGLLRPDSGAIQIDGEDVIGLSGLEREQVMRKFGMLFQGSALFDSLSVEDNVRFPLDMFTDMSMEEKRDRVSFCLNRVNIINANKLLPSEISGGMQKRVAIARAIALNPRYLFCDEPNSGLDPKTSVLIDELIAEITEEYDITTIVNTHDMNSVMGIGEKVLFIYQGKKLWEGTKDDIMDSGNEELDNFVFASKLFQKIRQRP